MVPAPAQSSSYWSLVGTSGSERRALGWITLLSGVLALACMALGVHAAQYDMEAFADPVRLLDMAHVDLASLRAFMVLDMFGYYLLLAPIVFASHRFLARLTPWAQVLTACGLAYVLIGAIGAAILAAGWPSILAAHAVAGAQEALLLRSNFALLTQLVYDGLWNMLEVLFAGVWWLGLGLALWRQHRWFALLTLLSGLFPLLDSVAGMFALKALHDAMLSGYLLMGILWPVVLGGALLRVDPGSKQVAVDGTSCEDASRFLSA
jgi:hypothetical protein